MFDKLFTAPSVIDEYRSAPLAQDRLRYLLVRAEQGASAFTLKRIAMDQFRLVHLLQIDKCETVNRSQIEAAADERSRSGLSLSRNSGSRTSTNAFIGQSVRWLRYVARFEEDVQDLRHSYTAEIEAYKAWMRGDRGLSEATILCYCRAADDFMAWLSASNVPLTAATIVHVDRAIVWKVKQRHYSRSTINNYARRIRAFLAFAEHRGWCSRNTAAAIIPPRVYPDRNLPLKLSRDDLQRLLETTDSARPVDIRDRAILMLFIAYGLRAGEVAGLELDDFDWTVETITVRRPKTRRTHQYPLSRGVGGAILRYIMEVRPLRQERSLFLTLKAPFRGLHQTGVTTIVARRLDRLGISSKRRGPHALRHAAAQHLLDHGMSMKVIGDFLGHSCLSSTAVYANVNLKALREVGDIELGGLT